MKKQPQTLLTIVMLMILAPVVCQANDESKPSSVARPRLGMNLSRPSYYNTELAFVDVFRLSSEWISQKKGGRLGQRTGVGRR